LLEDDETFERGHSAIRVQNYQFNGGLYSGSGKKKRSKRRKEARASLGSSYYRRRDQGALGLGQMAPEQMSMLSARCGPETGLLGKEAHLGPSRKRMIASQP
jgi:hypothetical protein